MLHVLAFKRPTETKELLTSLKQEESDPAGKLRKKIEDELSNEEKEDLFKVIGFQENAPHGNYPKDFEAYKLEFRFVYIF